MKKIGLFLICAALLGGCMKPKVELPDFNKMWDYNNPTETEIKFRALVEDAKANDIEYYGELLTQIARIQGLQRKFEEADKTLEMAKEYAIDKYPTVKIRYILEKGRVLNSSGKGEESIPVFKEAYDFGMKHKLDFYTLDAAHMLGIVNIPEVQLEWNLKALKIAETSEDKRVKGWLGPLYNNIGWTYHDLEKYEEALDLFLKGYDWRVSVKDENGARIGKWTIGRAQRSLKRYDEALKTQMEVQDDFVKAGLEPDGYLYEEMAELHLIKGQADIARKYFELAWEKLSQDQWMMDNETERMNRLKKMADK